MTTTVDIKTKEELDQLLDQLRDARTHAAGLRAEKKAMIDAVQATSEFRALDDAENEASATVTALETEIQNAGVEFKTAGIDLPNRIKVKRDTVVNIINELLAKTWCISNFTPALTLDKREFKDAAKDGKVPAELVEIKVGWKTYIDTKL